MNQDKFLNKVINKRNIKKANNMDTIVEETILVNAFLEKIPSVEEKYKENQKVILHPLTKCCKIWAIYQKSFFEMQKCLHDVECNNTMEAWKLFYESFLIFNEIQLDFSDVLLDYGDFVPATEIKELPERFMLSHEDFLNNTAIHNILFSVEILERLNKHIDNSLKTADKGKCMTLSAYIAGCSYNILRTIETKKTSCK